MTIVRKTNAIRLHPLITIEPGVNSLLERAYERLKTRGEQPASALHIPLRLLDCYCDLTGQSITIEVIQSPLIAQILNGYTSAMAGQELVESTATIKIRFIRTLIILFNEIAFEVPSAYEVQWEAQFFVPCHKIDTSLRTAPMSKRTYWKGWTIEGKPDTHLRIAQIFNSHGSDFAQFIFNNLEMRYKKSSHRNLFLWNKFFDYLAKNSKEWPISIFYSENSLREFIQRFTLHHFKEAKDAGFDPQSQVRGWSRFLNDFETRMCRKGVWAKLSSPFKRPSLPSKRGDATKTKKNAEGLLVQEKLLTQIPLSVTDTEAMELLFHQINCDVTIVRNWATAQAADLYDRYSQRIKLAKQGKPITNVKGRFAYKRYTLADLCATLECSKSTVPNEFLRKIYTHLTGEECDAIKLAKEFGFPMPGDLFAHQCLLVLEHPIITTEFLFEHRIVNEDGISTGFVPDNNTLTGFKGRKDPECREQIVYLTEHSKKIVQQIVDITDVLRRKLKYAKNNNHCYLLLSSGNGFAPINRAKVRPWNESTFKNNSDLKPRLIAEFSRHCSIPEPQLLDLIKRVKLTRIRDSRAVQIYIETRSAEAMAEALGHESYDPALLSHYLPEAILAFIKARWIRIFQKSLICEAMKDSKYLLRATRFTKIEDLHSFLEKHRIKSIPEEASNPSRKNSKAGDERSEAVLSVSVPFLAALLSLEAAVSESKQRANICGIAVYWSNVADKLKSEIISGYDRTLKSHLQKALKLVDPRRMEALIYAPTHWV
ncbi:hypothetical protein [Pseudomonas veronii]|uniref:hypothetical protein n=1 Tax=Pseudomonas veronii TaxID=76761 RepID=UPI002D78ADEC|nr:hypothetical protein [Pseudomonas veronii]WRU61138.1 hypothetical protein VPH48_23305 [Pseudomonas veronii]